MKLIHFATEKKLFIKRMIFPRKEIHNYTGISPYVKHKNQIDHFLINMRFKSRIINVRNLREIDSDSDNLLKMNICTGLKLKNHNKFNTTSMRSYIVKKMEDKIILRSYNAQPRRFLKRSR
jgi:hypothetical protein